MRSPYVLFACLLASFTTLLQKASTHAQLTPDQTLGAESSVVRFGINIDGDEAELIEGGATRGNNLFHSFSEFNVGTSERVYFDSPENIETILGRVTGNNLSSINGLLGTTGDSDAALILMNPNGIMFGAGSSLKTQGAFTATTATSIQLGEDGLFSAVAPQSDRLLSVDPSALFFNELGSTSDGISVEGTQLQMANGEAFRLLGGDVAIDSSGISAPNSRVEVVAVGDATVAEVGEEGAIALGEEGGRGNIAIENGSFIDVRSPEGGTIALISDDIQVLANSRLFAGVQPSASQSSSASEEDPPNFVALDATGLVQLSGTGTIVESSVLEGAVGETDGVVVEAGSIELSEGAQVYTITFGQGSSGDVTLRADSDISFIGNVFAGTITEGKGDVGSINITSTETVEVIGDRVTGPRIFSVAAEDSDGSSGSINIAANNFYVSGRSLISTGSFGSGSTGDILIAVDDNIRLGMGDSPEGAEGVSAINNIVGEQSLEPGGSIEISANSIELLNGFAVFTATNGEADAGNVTITASDSLGIVGANLVSEIPASSEIFSFSSGTGQAGNVEIVAGSLKATEGGRINSGATEGGSVGSVDVRVSGDATFDGFNSRTFVPSGIGSSSPGAGLGDGGAIRLSARNLSITNGAQLSVSLFSTGKAGDIDIDVLETVLVDGVNSGIEVPSSIDSRVSLTGRGEGGDIEITASEVILTNGGLIDASTFGVGEAGNVTINASEAVRIDGVNSITGRNPSAVESDIQSTQLEEESKGGTVTITTGELELANGGKISTSSFSRGDAGDIVINASDAVRLDGVTPVTGTGASMIASSIQSDAIGDGGMIQIHAEELYVSGGAQIDTSIFGTGNAGDILLNVDGTIQLSGEDTLTGTIPNSIGSGVETEGRGNGGNLDVSAKNLYVTGDSGVTTANVGLGNAGRIFLNVDERIRVEGTGGIFTRSVAGSGGEIVIQSDSVVLRDDGSISTRVGEGEGTGGNLTIDANYVVALDNGDILALSVDGRGGDVDLSRAILFSQNLNMAPTELSADTANVLIENNRVDINASGSIAPGQVLINDASFIEADLAELPSTLVDTDSLIANACIARRQDDTSTFVVRGSDRAPLSPTDPLFNNYSLGTIQSIAESDSALTIQEPEAVYQTSDGRLLISHRCRN